MAKVKVQKSNKEKGMLNETMRKSYSKYFAFFMLPVMCAFAIGFVWPFLQGLFLSFFKFKTLKKITFVGLENYINAFRDITFFQAFLRSSLFTILSTVIINIIAFALAYLLTKKLKGSTVFRTIFFMPNLVGGIVLAYVWKQILESFAIIFFDTSMQLNSTLAFWGLILVVAWQQIGYMMIIYIAGLQSVPGDHIEAATIDGANNWQILGKIILPTIAPSITICTFLSLTNGFKLFDQNLALTNGAPFNMVDGVSIGKTELLALNIYKSMYSANASVGVGQAKAVLFFIMVAVISIAQLSITKRRERQA